MTDLREVCDVGYASGVFDMFHVGHLNLLRRARAHCRQLVVGVASDEYVERLKGYPPVVPCDERIDIITALGIVDQVVIDRDADKTLVWQQIPFDVIFKGSDWEGTAKGYRLEAEMKAVGAKVVYFPYTRQTSSSMLRTFLTDRNRRGKP
ncbi:adenylyltransferase/cytidyltransferase family protein [Aeromicrobium sp.]|uniref:adenylyltransferase/cytidyltransferase family protein n=1 Tax=Aeromicrobium sp. TaxID=1871063 RepID=UPI003C4BDF5E